MINYAYYNEIDPKACAWIRQLIKNDLIMDGEVDERSIIDVQPNDLKGFTRHHFFSGIAGWDYALQLAGWPSDRHVCTASLPCQPFSVAGQQKGKEDDRHLLPHFIELVKQCNFKTIFGEQVPAAIRHGWLDDLCLEMERENYAVGSIVLTAAGAGAPHIRQRLYWVADHISKGRKEQPGERGISRVETGNDAGENIERSGGLCGMVFADGTGSQPRRQSTEAARHGDTIEPTSSFGGMGNAELRGCEREQINPSRGIQQTMVEQAESRKPISPPSARVNEWNNSEWLYCRDNKYRPIKSCIKPLANGLPKRVGYSSDPSDPIDADNTQEARVMRLKGYGNAIVPQIAASFIKAFMSV
jgi:DNA (cytosine-5)-methyltransferase 1